MTRKEQIEKELDRTRSYLPFIQRRLLSHMAHLIRFREATPEEDMQEGFDFVLSADSAKIAIRIRRPGCNYRDFTVRAQVPTGAKTEIHKIREGKGDIYFYAWTDVIDGKERITDYWLIDLDKFRNGDSIKKENFLGNGDGTGFFSYSLDSLLRDDAIICTINLKRLYAARAS